DLERGVFGGGADESEQATFHMRQEGILLALVEAVHFVNEQDGALRRETAARRFGALYRLANVLDAAQHGTDGDELGVEGIGHEPGDGGLPHARWTPEDA